MAAESDPLAIELVALDGHRMPLNKDERIEAIRIMAEHNVTRQVMAWRVCMSVDSLEKLAQRSGIKLPPVVKPAHWTVNYLERRTPEQRRQRNEKARIKRERDKQSEGTA